MLKPGQAEEIGARDENELAKLRRAAYAFAGIPEPMAAQMAGRSADETPEAKISVASNQGKPEGKL
jgi:hypothetical protein